MTRDLVGPGRKFMSDLYIPRPSTYEVFQSFKQNTTSCLAILGESGVGKSNLLVALSELDDEGVQTLFYEGIRLESGLALALKEDMPWAFGVNNSVDEAGKTVNEQFLKFGLKLYIFVDALDDVPVAMRTELIDVVRKLSLQGIRFVFSCKDVVWPEFVRRDGAPNAFADTIFPKSREEEKDKLPGWTLDRCDLQDLDAAWEKYSRVFNLTGDRSQAFNEEASLLYMLSVCPKITWFSPD